MLNEQCSSCRWAAQEGLPLGIGESDGFLEFCQTLCPRAPRFSRRSVTRRLEAIYQEGVEKVRAEVTRHRSEGIQPGLTADLWTSRAGHKYMTITIHSIEIHTSPWECKKWSVGAVPIDAESATAEGMCVLCMLILLCFDNVLYRRPNTCCVLQKLRRWSRRKQPGLGLLATAPPSPRTRVQILHLPATRK